MADPHHVELATTIGVGTDGPEVARLVKRELVRLGLRGLEATGEHLASVAPGSRLAMASMLVSLGTMAALVAIVALHEIGTSKYERAIEGLIDVLEKQNPASAGKLRDVERKMHR